MYHVNLFNGAVRKIINKSVLQLPLIIRVIVLSHSESSGSPPHCCDSTNPSPPTSDELKADILRITAKNRRRADVKIQTSNATAIYQLYLYGRNTVIDHTCWGANFSNCPGVSCSNVTHGLCETKLKSASRSYISENICCEKLCGL